MKTWYPDADTVLEKNWWLIDASGKKLGRLASEVAKLVRGKNKPTFTPNVDTGDFVVVINANKIDLSGNKWNDKIYYRHSLHFGGMKEFTAEEMKARDPVHMIRAAVEDMLPSSRLARVQINHLKTYADAVHPHAAQKPQALNLK